MMKTKPLLTERGLGHLRCAEDPKFWFQCDIRQEILAARDRPRARTKKEGR